MDNLPHEIIISILDCCVVNHYGDKNSLLALRRVCKLFDDILKPFVLRTLQLEFTRLDKVSRSKRPLDDGALQRIGHLCQALYLDMMVIRDDGEVMYLGKIFNRVPSMGPFVTTLRDRYCMNEKSFTEVEYRNSLGKMLECAPRVSAVRLNLPFQLISKHCRAATMILGNSLEALAQRPEESDKLKTLVLENVTDTTIVKLWRNPRDVKNIIDVFADLKHLLMSVRRHEDGYNHTVNFRHRLWEMIGKAEKLLSLCLISLDLDERPFKTMKQTTQRDCTMDDWSLKSLPPIRKPPKVEMPHLTYLELRRVEVLPCGLLSMFKCFGSSLQELYLNQVYLKTTYNADLSPQDATNTLWIGLPNVRPHADHRWIATYLRQMKTQLRICRVTHLGYDQYMTGQPPDVMPRYDLDDPCDLGRSLEQRFVEVVMGMKQPNAPDGTAIAYWPEDDEQTWAHADQERPENMVQSDWNATVYLALENNPTSIWQKTIDCQFPNCNQFTLDELHRFADMACEGMNEMNRAITRELEEEELGWIDHHHSTMNNSPVRPGTPDGDN